MMWESIALLLKWIILGWFAAIALLILYKIMAREIPVAGVLRHNGEMGFGFHRLQMLGITLIFAIGYVTTALRQPAGMGMPDISTPLLATLLGSHVAYLGGKLLRK